MYLRHVAVRAARLNDQLIALDICGMYVHSLFSSNPIHLVALYTHNLPFIIPFIHILYYDIIAIYKYARTIFEKISLYMFFHDI